MEETMNTVIGIFTQRSHADNAIHELKNMGYDPKDMSIMMKEEPQKVGERKIGSKGGSTASGAITGAAAGGIFGGITGLLMGVGLIAIPGLGAVLIGGPFAVLLGATGAAATAISGATTGIFAGGLMGALIGLGIPEEVAQIYERRVTEGAIFLAVPIRQSNSQKIESVFEKNHADQMRVI